MSSSNGASRELSVGIVGAGFGGVGIGIRLRQAGFENFEIFERGEGVGGVWRANTYPGAACDVPSHLYSFSFAPGRRWSRRYAPQAEILAYLEECAERFGIVPHLRSSTEVVEARFDPGDGRWTLRTDSGSTHEFDVLVTACGQLARPDIPALPGSDGFDGPAFHSADWDHGVELDGRRVAVIGTGASAIQFVPEIAPRCERLTVYQRSAPWVIPKSDRVYAEWERRLFERFPLRVAASRLGVFGLFEVGTYGFTGHPWIGAPLKRLAERERRQALGDDPDLLAKTAPTFEFGCKRVLISNDWYPTLKRPNVELVHGPIERITPRGVLGPDGVEREADVIIYGTGFQTQNFVAPMEVQGLGGRELNEVWAGRAEAYLGITVSGFPNMFVLYGPNTNHGLGSIVYTLECQFNYVIDALERLRAGGLRWLEVRPEAQRAWRKEIDERSTRTVWTTGGCNNWYLNERGENTSNWPGPWLEYRRRTRRLNPGDYRVAV